MRLSLKFFIAFIGLTLVVLLMTLSLARISFQWGFLEFINGLENERLARYVTLLTDYYEEQGSWDDVGNSELAIILDQAWSINQRANKRPPPPHRRDLGPPPPRGGKGRPGRPLPQRAPPTALYDVNDTLVIGIENSDVEYTFTLPLNLDNQLIGEIRSAPRQLNSSSVVTKFNEQQLRSSIYIGVISLILSLIVAAFLTKRLLRPIQQAKDSISRLVSGDYGFELKNQQLDELGVLLRDISILSRTLESNQNSQNRWIADISHELRTPLTVMQGEIEAIQCGVRHDTDAAIESLAAEVAILSQLVNDLYTLSITELGALRYKFEVINVSTLIETMIEPYSIQTQNHGLDLITDIQDDVQWSIDAVRFQQIIHNLLDNAIKYTESPGKIILTLKKVDTDLLLTIEDSSPGCSKSECDELFNSLYRTDKARSRTSASGAGLGLAIVKNIAVAHNGSILAKPSRLGGVYIEITLRGMSSNGH